MSINVIPHDNSQAFYQNLKEKRAYFVTSNSSMRNFLEKIGLSDGALVDSFDDFERKTLYDTWYTVYCSI